MGKQKTYQKLIEWLADMEHQQWIGWTIYFLRNLKQENFDRWARQVKTPYSKLSEEEKESDREWAEKIIDGMPFKCPIYQCGGIMKFSIRKKPKDIDADIEGYDGDEQSPDLVCTNCGAVYQFTK